MSLMILKMNEKPLWFRIPLQYVGSTTTNHIQDVSICLLDTSYTLRLIVEFWRNVKKCVSSHRKLIEVRGERLEVRG